MEEVAGYFYLENLKLLGEFLTDIMLTELFDSKGEFIEGVTRIYTLLEVRLKLS